MEDAIGERVIHTRCGCASICETVTNERGQCVPFSLISLAQRGHMEKFEEEVERARDFWMSHDKDLIMWRCADVDAATSMFAF